MSGNSDPVIMMIGEYQFFNLLKNQVGFFLFYFSDSWNEKWKNARVTPQSATLETLNTQVNGLDKDAPIVLICENGKTSLDAAKKLEAQGFINIFVLEDGIKSLKDQP